MQNDLISRSALLKKAQWFECPSYEVWDYSFKYVDPEDVEDAPAVDAVEVVRCKNCREWKLKDRPGATWGMCRTLLADMPPDGYCNYGERRADV